MDDRRQTGVEGDTVVVNMAIASSQASIYQECVEKTGQSGIEVPSYTWFLLQFWPCSDTAVNMLHYKGRFIVKRMIEAGLCCKNNHDDHYYNAIFNVMKQRVINHMTDSAFFSAAADCKLSVGEPDFPLASPSRGRKVVVGVNQSFRVVGHDFSMVSLFPDAIFVQNIPDLKGSKPADEYLHDES